MGRFMFWKNDYGISFKSAISDNVQLFLHQSEREVSIKLQWLNLKPPSHLYCFTSFATPKTVFKIQKHHILTWKHFWMQPQTFFWKKQFLVKKNFSTKAFLAKKCG